MIPKYHESDSRDEAKSHSQRSVYSRDSDNRVAESMVEVEKGIRVRKNDVETPQERLCDRFWSENNAISNQSIEHIMGKG